MSIKSHLDHDKEAETEISSLADSLVNVPETVDTEQVALLDKIFVILGGLTGHDFSLYKKNTLYRRIERRMGIHRIEKMAIYVDYLRENHAEAELLFKELLIGVTNFFRDPAAWEQLKAVALSNMKARPKPKNGMWRAWVPGCSTGEEAYSLAILLTEAHEEMDPGSKLALQVFATDLDDDAIAKARKAIYPPNISADVDAKRLQRFFVQEDHGYRVCKEIREMVVFAKQNIISDPPFTRLDFLSCRNLLIYFELELQKKLLPLFHYSLNSGGILALGSAETVGSFTNLFSVIEGQTRLFQRIDSDPNWKISFPSPLIPSAFQSADESPVAAKITKPVVNIGTQIDQLLLAHYTPSAVLVNVQGDILYVSGHTGKYLEPPAGKPNMNIFSMAREGMRYPLSEAFERALRAEQNVSVNGVRVSSNDGSEQVVDITIQPLKGKDDKKGKQILIVFTEVKTPVEKKTRSKKTNSYSDDLEQQLYHVHRELLTTREQMQTSNEELKSTNEELQSTNEELQSANEELTTSKEEMQSINEELQTVNHDLMSKVAEFSRVNDDMKNLLNSTDIATLFLDSTFRIRRFTSQVTKVFKLIPGDVGRLITDIASDLNYPTLFANAREVLRTLIFLEKPISANDGRWYLVRIMPYRTTENKIDGVVITFTDITASKQLEIEQQKRKKD